MPTYFENGDEISGKFANQILITAAHRIKGSASSMRLGILAKIAEKIESESIANWNDNIELQLAELKAEWEIVKVFIQQKLN
jgi:HPt (histidine-containing phosphotransfer) domain-containing protein